MFVPPSDSLPKRSLTSSSPANSHLRRWTIFTSDIKKLFSVLEWKFHNTLTFHFRRHRSMNVEGDDHWWARLLLLRGLARKKRNSWLRRGHASSRLSERAGGTRAEDRLLLQNYTREIHSEQSSIEVAAEQQKKRGMKEQVRQMLSLECVENSNSLLSFKPFRLFSGGRPQECRFSF